jgi:hypothetical protein
MGAVILLLTLSVGALSSVGRASEPAAARLTIVPPSTTADAPVATPVSAPTTAPPAPSTTAAPAATVLVAPKASPATTTPATTEPTRRPAPVAAPAMVLTPNPVHSGGALTVTGRCPAGATLVSLNITDRSVPPGTPGSRQFTNANVWAADGSWETTFVVNLDPGSVAVNAICPTAAERFDRSTPRWEIPEATLTIT